MNIVFNGDFTSAMKDYVYEKVSKVTTFSNYSDAKIKLLVLSDGKFNVEISLDNVVRAEKTGDDFYALVTDVVEKLVSQIIRYKEYLQFRYRTVEDKLLEEGDPVSRSKVLIPDELSREEAIETMEYLGHSFFIYKDIDLGNNICVVYKRHAGDYGIIECR